MTFGKLRWYIVLTILGFTIAMGVGLYIYTQSNNMIKNFSNLSKKYQKGNITICSQRH